MEMTNERKHFCENNEKRDLLSNLVSANEEFLDDGEQRLGQEELTGMGSGLGLPVHSFKCLPPRKHVRFLHRWTRGEDSLVNTRGRLIPAT